MQLSRLLTSTEPVTTRERRGVGILVGLLVLWLARDFWLGAPVIALAWLAHHLGASWQAMTRGMHAGTKTAVTWPTWSWADFTSWYHPSIAASWAHIWHDPTLASQTRTALIGLGLLVAVAALALWRQTGAPKIRTAQFPWQASWATNRDLMELNRRAPALRLSAVVAAVAPRLPTLPAALQTRREHWQQWAQDQEAQQPPPDTYIHAGRYLGRDRWFSPRLQEMMIFLTATTGSGKTSGFIAPAILRELGARSLYIPDPKSELWRLTSGAVALHHRVWRFAPSDPDQSHCYNPLAFVTDRRSARKLADCFLANTGEAKGSDSYWTNLARSLIVGAALHAKATNPDASLYLLVEWFTSLSLTELTAMLHGSANKDARDVAKTIGDEMQKNPKVEGIVMPDLATRWDQLKTEQIARVTAKNDIHFTAMTTEAVALYSCVAAGDAKEYAFLTACLMMQMFGTLVGIAGQHGGELPRPVALYLDEFTNQGVIPDFITYLSTLRSTRVAIFIAVQSYAQVRQKYGPDVLEAIRSICNTHITLPGAGQEECEFFTKRIGETTITPNSASRGFEPLKQGHRLSYSAGEAKRELITTNEIRCLPKWSALIIISHLPPFISQVQPYYAMAQKTLANLTPPSVPPAPEYVEIAAQVVTPVLAISPATITVPSAATATAPLVDPAEDSQEAPFPADDEIA